MDTHIIQSITKKISVNGKHTELVKCLWGVGRRKIPNRNGIRQFFKSKISTFEVEILLYK